MNEIRKLLLGDQADRAVERFVALLEDQPGDARNLTRGVTALLVEQYNRLLIQPVHRFHDLIPMMVPPPIVAAISKALDAPIERTKLWLIELEGVTRERLTREARAAVTGNDPKAAVARLLTLLGRGKTSEDYTKLARMGIEAIAAQTTDRERGRAVAAALAKSPGMEHLDFDFAASFEESTGRQALQYEANSGEGLRALNAAAVRLKEALPGPNETGEPSADNIQAFTTEIGALLRAGAASGGDDDFIDALSILMEYCPSDPREFESLAGVEDRMFLTLGPKARLTAVRTLSRVGDNDLIRTRILTLSQSSGGAGRVAMLVTVMGGLRHVDFFPYLKQARKQAISPGARAAIDEALSRMQVPEAADLILDDLARGMKKALDPAGHRAIRMQLTCLGRIVRLRGVEPARRNQIVNRVVKLVGEEDWGLAVFAVEKMFATAVQDLDLEARRWGVRQIVRAMFGRGGSATPAGQNDNSPRGFRKPLTAILMRMGKSMQDDILAIAEPHAATYGGASIALAEVLQKIGDKRAVPMLELMTRTAFLHREAEDAGEPEMAHNPTTDEMEPLKRDDVTHTLLYTLAKIGGEAGRQAVLRYADQVQAGQLESPGNATSSFLLQAKRESGTLGKIETKQAPNEEMEEGEIKKLAARARGKMFGKGRKQVAALAALGQCGRPEAVGAILHCLHGKDPMVVSAAETALADLVTPPPSPAAFESMMNTLFADEKQLRDPALARLIAVIERAFPKKAPYDKLYRKVISIEIGEEGRLAHRLLCAIRRKKKAEAKGTADFENEPDDPIGDVALKKQNLLRQKQLYLQNRRLWVAKGKHGPAPTPPPEVARALAGGG